MLLIQSFAFLGTNMDISEQNGDLLWRKPRQNLKGCSAKEEEEESQIGGFSTTLAKK